MSGLIPRSFIDELLARTDLVTLIDSYVPLKKRGKSHITCCPFHNEKTPSFNVNALKQFYHCFGCGASGNAISFIMNYLQLGFVEAIEMLAGQAGLQVPREKGGLPQKSSSGLYPLLQEVALFYKQALKYCDEAITYLKHRKLNGETARLYQLGYAPNAWHALEKQFTQQHQALLESGLTIQKDSGSTFDRFRHRIMFPIHDRLGRIVGFGARAIDAHQQPKYLNSPETPVFQKNRELYGLYQIIQHTKSVDTILIVEGYMDVLALAQHGVSNVVATLGTATSAQHIQLLSKYTNHLSFCFDGDAAGREAAWRALENSLPFLNTGIDVGFIFLPEGYDPDSLIHEKGKEAFLKRISQSMPLHQFFFKTLMESLDTSSLAGKSRLLHTAKPHLIKMGAGPYRDLMYAELARFTHIDLHRISQLIESPERHLAPADNTHELGTGRSPIRMALALLIQRPQIIKAVEDELHDITLEGKNQNMLQMMISKIMLQPDISTAALVELWRETPAFETLNKLAVWDHQIPEDAQAKAFMETIVFLSKKNHENKIQQLLDKARNQGLTVNERMCLQEMLKQRHKNGKDETSI